MTGACTVYVCDAQPVVIEGLRNVLDEASGFRLVGDSGTPDAALEEIARLLPGVVILDQHHGWRRILHFVGELKQVSPETKSVLWGEHLTAGDCYRALQLGVRGVFNRTQPVEWLLDCLREVAAGRVWMEGVGDAGAAWVAPRPAKPRLTPRERDVVRLIAQGLKNREIAERLSITPGTVKVHLMHVFEKSGVKDRFQLAARARSLLGEGDL